MADTPPFKEDFFERVINVKWEAEPEVFWIIGSGHPNIVNGMSGGDNHAWIWTSPNGKKWKGKDMWAENTKGFGVIYGGFWMREDLEEGAPPVWVLVGGSNKTQMGSCSIATNDGETLYIEDRVFFDERHAADRIFQGQGGVFVEGQETFTGHRDYLFTADGWSYAPPNVHGGEDTSQTGTLAVQAAAFDTRELVPVSSDRSVYRALSSEAPGEPTPMLASELPSQFAAATGSQSKADKIVLQIGTHRATGKVIKGPFRGKVLDITIDPYHTPSGGGAHGDNTVRVVDAKEQKFLGVFDVEIERTQAIGYGHYVFVVVGSSGTAKDANGQLKQKSTLAWSEDGVNWVVREMGLHAQINAIAVGPRDNMVPKPEPPEEEPDAPAGPTGTAA